MALIISMLLIVTASAFMVWWELGAAYQREKDQSDELIESEEEFLIRVRDESGAFPPDDWDRLNKIIDRAAQK